jgi:hypothetical protein
MARRKLVATPWFDGKHYIPSRIGVYEREIPHVPGRTFSRWDGRQWLRHALTPDDANLMREPSSFQDVLWRGFESEPTKKDKKFWVYF